MKNASSRLNQIQIVCSCVYRIFLFYIYKFYVRRLLEFISQICSPHLLGVIDRIVSVQRKFTRRLLGLNGKFYLQHLSEVSLEFLEARRFYNDLVLLYMIAHDRVEVEKGKISAFNTLNLGGHCSKVELESVRVGYKNIFLLIERQNIE